MKESLHFLLTAHARGGDGVVSLSADKSTHEHTCSGLGAALLFFGINLISANKSM